MSNKKMVTSVWILGKISDSSKVEHWSIKPRVAGAIPVLGKIILPTRPTPLILVRLLNKVSGCEYQRLYHHNPPLNNMLSGYPKKLQKIVGSSPTLSTQ